MMLKAILFALIAIAVYADRMESVKEILVSFCYKNNAGDKVEQVKILIDEYLECQPKIVAIEQLAGEFNDPGNGTVKEVAKNYCSKAADMISCMAKINNVMGMCLKMDQNDIQYEVDALNRMMDYMCFEVDDKTRLATFVDNGGMRCLTSKVKNFSQCQSINPKSIKQAVEKASRCLVDVLKSCSNAAALQVQDMFKHVLNATKLSSGDNANL